MSSKASAGASPFEVVAEPGSYHVVRPANAEAVIDLIKRHGIQIVDLKFMGGRSAGSHSHDTVGDTEEYCRHLPPLYGPQWRISANFAQRIAKMERLETIMVTTPSSIPSGIFQRGPDKAGRRKTTIREADRVGFIAAAQGSPDKGSGDVVIPGYPRISPHETAEQNGPRDRNNYRPIPPL